MFVLGHLLRLLRLGARVKRVLCKFAFSKWQMFNLFLNVVGGGVEIQAACTIQMLPLFTKFHSFFYQMICSLAALAIFTLCGSLLYDV